MLSRCHAISLPHSGYAGGENVYCSEVEAVLSAHSQVLQAAVFGMPNSVMGEMVHAAVVLRHPPSTPATPQHLITWCQSQLALYKCPTAVHILEELPTTGSGKVLKNVLRATFSRGGCNPAAAAAVATPVAAAMTAAVASEVPASAGPLLAAAAAAATAAVDAVALCKAKTDAHTPSPCSSTEERNDEAGCVAVLDAVTAQCPGAGVLHYTCGFILDPAESYMVVVGNWTTAVTQVCHIAHHHSIPCLHSQGCLHRRIHGGQTGWGSTSTWLSYPWKTPSAVVFCDCSVPLLLVLHRVHVSQ